MPDQLSAISALELRIGEILSAIFFQIYPVGTYVICAEDYRSFMLPNTTVWWQFLWQSWPENLGELATVLTGSRVWIGICISLPGTGSQLQQNLEMKELLPPSC